ncbi:terminase family protein [Anaerovoracaceae bacterium 41-7]
MIEHKKKVVMSDTKWSNMVLDAETTAFYRRNPCIAAEDLIGVQLIDSQAWMLESSWNTPNVVWACSRNFGKSFLIAIMAILKAILYENQNIYIISSVGSQSKETFEKIEQLVLRRGQASETSPDLIDIVEKETVKSPSNKTGFKHNPESYSVTFYNGSSIYTLNSKPDNIRGKRATVVFFDEAAFCSDEILSIARAFGAQDTNFKAAVNDAYDIRKQPLQVPIQTIYASSQDTMDTTFYKNYKDFAKEMIAGNRNFFVCDMPCTTAINIYMKGNPYPPLLSQDKVDTALQENKEKALREYFNIPTRDGGASQIIKWGAVRRNEHDIIPYAEWRPENKIVMAFDPARTNDNSILGVMNIVEDPELGLCGDIINFVNFVDTASRKKLKLDSNRQIASLRNYLLLYNGDNPDYEYIDSLLIDSGSGGGGVSTYGDRLLEDWRDSKGHKHRGLIDKTNEIYAGYSKRYRNAADKLRLINPSKYRTQMVEEFIELFELGVIRLPKEYNNQDFLRIPQGNNQEDKIYYLSTEEKVMLNQIDLMKTEITSIHKTTNPDKTSVRYALPKEKENRLHDDRFYVMILLAHRLYELRREKSMRHKNKNNNKDISSLLQVRAPKLR